MKPKISVIIPVYNAEKYLRECLDSVTGQTWKDIEIICVDDGSTDRSAEILREYAAKDGRVQVLQQKNQFAGVARNNGLKRATGEYVFFMDGDDYCDRRLLERAIDEAERTAADMVVFDHYRCDETEKRLERKRDVPSALLPEGSTTFNYRSNPGRIMSMVNPVPWNKVMRRRFLLDWELEFEPLSSTNDITFSALSVASASKIAYLDEPLLTYRVNLPGSITSTKTKNLNNVVQALCQTYYKARKLPHYYAIEASVQMFVAKNLLFALNHYAGEPGSPSYQAFLAEIKKIFFGLPLFYDVDDSALKDPKLSAMIREYSEEARADFDTKYFPRITVSLTSYPKRIGTVHQTVETMLRQTMRPERIVLWLAESQFPGKEGDLPENLTRLLSPAFQIRWTEDLKSYKKLIPSLKAFPDDIIITVDDDLLFDPHIVERLVKGYREKPECIQCHRITTVTYHSLHEITTTPDALKVYPIPTYLHKLSGGAGCLYPPCSLHPDVFRQDVFMKIAPTSDDIWFWLMGALNGYKVNVVKDNIPKLTYIPGTQEEALWKQNDRGESLFFVHLRNILCYYPVLQDVLSYEQMLFDTPAPAAESKAAAKAEVKSSLPIEDMKRLRMQLTMQQHRADLYLSEIQAIHASATYKIGRVVTWLPRKLRGGVRCYREHGMRYTAQRLLVHLHLAKDEYASEIPAPVYKQTSRPVKAEGPAAKAPVPQPQEKAAKAPVPQTQEKAAKTPAPQPQEKPAKKPAPVRRDYEYYRMLPQEKYADELKLWFKRVTGETLNLENPRTYNEKIQWMKLYDSTPLKTRLADKYLVRDWVKEKIGEKYLVPLLGVWDSFDEIDFDELPNSFVLKANHGCGWNIIVKDKSKFNIAEAREKFNTWMGMNFAFKFGLELHYMNIPPKIIAEEYMENDNNDLYDYKVFCFGGKAESVMYLSERKSGLKMAFFDTQWKKLPYTYSFPRNEAEIPKPKNLELLISLSEKLSAGFPHARIDFYILNDGSLKFGEITFSSASGSCKWNPPEQNAAYGDLIQLPPKSPLPEKLF